METTNNQYIPGTCNIGKEEIAARKTVTYVNGAIIIICIFLLQFFHASHLWRLLIFVPVASFAVNLQQVLYKFCVNFGIRGVFNFGNLGATYTVEQKEFARRDRAKAWQMILTAVAIGVAAAIVYYYLPV